MSMENIRSRNVYLEMVDREEEKEEEKKEAHSEGVDGASTNERKRKLPYWKRLNNGEEAKYTDWTLDVHLSNNNDVDDNDSDAVSYLVHRYQLGIQSEYFEGIFRDSSAGGFSESYQKRSVIKLPSPIVTIHHFENLLDYLYTGKLVLNSDSAVSMIYFGDYFGINPLKERAQSFIRKIIAAARTSTSETDTLASFSMMLSTLYRDAKIHAMKELQEAIVYECASEPALMSKDTELSKIPDIQFWCHVLAAKKSHPQKVSSNKLWSINVYHFIELHADIVDCEIFCKLIHKDSLPIISADAALGLMEQQHKRPEDIEEVRENELTCLQQRCTDSLIDIETGVWKVKNPHTLLEGRIGNIPSTVLESLFMLRALDDEKKPKICRDSITVSGAGNEFVNGVYSISGLYEKCPMFTRSGRYAGRNGLFSISKCSDGYWYISFTLEGVRLGSRQDIDFYETTTSEEDKLFPDTDWETASSGIEPIPTLEFVYA